MPMILPITLTFAAAATLLNLWLAGRVIRNRFSYKTLHGDGGHDPLLRGMRAQSNFVEYTPFALILMGLVEMARGSSLWLWILAAAYILGRIAHAIGMNYDRPSRWRATGMLFTVICLVALAATALVTAYRAETGVRTESISVNV